LLIGPLLYRHQTLGAMDILSARERKTPGKKHQRENVPGDESVKSAGGGAFHGKPCGGKETNEVLFHP